MTNIIDINKNKPKGPKPDEVSVMLTKKDMLEGLERVYFKHKEGPKPIRGLQHLGEMLRLSEEIKKLAMKLHDENERKGK